MYVYSERGNLFLMQYLIFPASEFIKGLMMARI